MIAQSRARRSSAGPDTVAVAVQQALTAQGERGFIQCGEDRHFNITLLQNADLSTLLHSHFFLKVAGMCSPLAGSDAESFGECSAR